MILVVSDLHLGKRPELDRSSLSDLRACIDHYPSPPIRIVFLGDTFDAFIEYPGRIPAPVQEWSILVRDLMSQNIEVTYFAGNHDRWHLGFISNLLRRPVARKPEVTMVGGRTIWMEHGDQADKHSRLVQLGRVVSDNSIVYKLLTWLLPFGGGQLLASQVSRHFAGFEPNLKTVSALQAYAHALLGEKKCDVVIMGHCHRSGMEMTEFGTYVNTGDWYQGRTFAMIDPENGFRISLMKWTPDGPEIRSEEDFSSI